MTIYRGAGISAVADVPNEDKGDITVSARGATWNINAGVVTTIELGGDITTAGKALLDDVDTAAQRTTLGLGSIALQGDGDKGDITVSSGGTVWTVDNDSITYSKIQNVSATDKLLGRSTAGAGDIEEIACTAAGRALLDDADATSQRVTLSAAKSGANSDITSITGLTTALSIAQGGTGSTSGNLIAIGATGIGYGTGAGGTVTQATSKSTDVTLNKPTGQITMNNSALASGAVAQFALNNTLIGPYDLMLLTNDNGNYVTQVPAVITGAAIIRITNVTAGSLSESFSVKFAIIKGSIS